MNNFTKNLVQTLLFISENTIPFTTSSFFKCFKVVMYLLQLFGYVYSEYESKPLTTPELNYLAQFTQLSPGTFALLQYKDDQLTKIFFYSMFSLHLSIYLTIVYLSINKGTNHSWIYKILNFFFINFMWLFLTPFQEICIGMLVCGRNSFLSYNVNEENCSSNNSIFQYIVGVSGIGLVTFTGFITVYFFRDYQFFNLNFARRFSIITYSRLLLHQIIQICYYLYLPSLDYIKHALTHILMVNIVFDSLSSFPFGFFFEARFFSSFMCCSEYFMLLISIWLFSDLNSNIIFLTFFVFQPVIVVIALMLNDNQRIKLIVNFNPQSYNENSTVYLEEVFRCAVTYYHAVESKVQLLYILKSHTERCQIVHCPCGQDVMNFIDASNNVNWKTLNEWTQQIFDQILAISLSQREYNDFQHFALKYSTFLQQYKNNPILSYGILQDILISQISVKRKLNQIHFKPSFFFTEIIDQIQNRNIQQIKAMNEKTSKLNLLESNLLQNINYIEDYGELLQENIIRLLSEQINFWNSLIQNQISSFDQLKDSLQSLYNQKQKCKKYYQQIDAHAQSQLIVRFQLIYYFCCERDYASIQKYESILNQMVLTETLDQVSCFKAAQFLTHSSYTLIGTISPQNNGKILNRIDKNFLDFFHYENHYDELYNISSLMPKFIGQIHKDFIQQFLIMGVTNKINRQFSSYILNGSGFIEKVKVLLNFYFPENNQSKQFLMMSHVRKSNIIKQDITDLEQNDQIDGIIILDREFKIQNLTQNVYDRVSSYILQLRSIEDILNYSNIFKMIPSLFSQFSHFYNDKTTQFLSEGTHEIANFSDVLQTSYDPEFLKYKRSRKGKVKNYTNKERIKSLNFIKQSLSMQSTRQINQTPIECQVNQVLINYYQQGTPTQLLYYELIIKFKHELSSVKTKNNFIQILNKNVDNIKIETGKIQSLDNIDMQKIQCQSNRSEIPILSQDEVEIQNNENNSISSLQSGITDIKQLKNFQRFIKGKRQLLLIKELLVLNLTYIVVFVIVSSLLIYLRYNLLYVSTDTITNQFSFQQEYVSSMNIMNLQRRQLFIEEFNELFQQINLENILSDQTIIEGQLNQINNLKMEMYISEWTQAVETTFLDHSFNLTQYNMNLTSNKFTHFNSTLLEYIQQINNYIYFYNKTYQNTFIDQILLAQLILNYEQINLINEEFLINSEIDNSSNYQSFQIIASIICLFIIGSLIFSFSRSTLIFDRLAFILSGYLTIDTEQIFQELQMLEIQHNFMKNESPWTKEKSFQLFLQDSNSFIENLYKHQQSQSIRKLEMAHKSTKIKVEVQKLSIGKLILYSISFLLLNLLCHGVTWIKYTYSYNNSTQNFGTIFSVMQFQIKYCNILTIWDLYLQNGIYQTEKNQQWYNWIYDELYFNSSQLDIEFQDLKTNKFEQISNLLDYNNSHSNICDAYICNKLDYWQQLPLSDQLLGQVLQEGLILNLQKVLSFISLYQGFEFNPTEEQLMDLYFQQDYFIYFYWANDIIQSQIDIIISNELGNIKYLSDQSIILDTALIISLLCLVTFINIYLVYRQNCELIYNYSSLLDTLIFIPYNAQSRLMAKNFLSKLRS